MEISLGNLTCKLRNVMETPTVSGASCMLKPKNSMKRLGGYYVTN